MVTAARAASEPVSRFDFPEVTAGVDADHHVAEGYDADVLLRWGDPVFPDSPAFDPLNQSPEAQARQFGYNADYVGYLPIDGSSEHGLLVVNHEYTNAHLMFPDLVTVAATTTIVGGEEQAAEYEVTTAPADARRVAIEMAAHGGTVVEIRKVDGKWRVMPDGAKNRRITADTPMAITGPAAGHPRLQTAADPTGTAVLGTINNCAGGVTPWGTWLTAEENFHGYFMGELPEGHPEAGNYARLGLPDGTYEWGSFHDRFDVSKEPNEPNRFGWIVEVDVEDPASTPKKRTALGRFKHEGCESVVNGDGRVVLYLGDDERFDYVYKFVTEGRFDPENRAANADLLDAGTLYVARFDPDGTMEWLPLLHGADGLDRRERLRQPGRRDDRDPPRRRPPGRHAHGPPRGRASPTPRPDASTSCSPTTPGASGPTPPTRGPTTPSATSSRSPRRTATSPPPAAPGRSS